MDAISLLNPQIAEYLTNLLSYNSDAPLLFNSGQFLVLFIGFFSLYNLLYQTKHLRTVYVIAFSLFFYYKSSGFYFFILLFSTIVDFFLGQMIYQMKEQWEKKLFLVISIVFNLGVLAYFKYTNFFISTLNDVVGGSIDTLDIFLPVGISFYTFQTMSYSIDIYRGKLYPVKNILDFAFFVSFFPQLVAGPIVRASEFLPQIHRRLHLSIDDMGRAFLLICGGLFKKAVISDYIGVNFVDRIFDNPSLYTGVENLIGVYGYALQIYCDFSGYSDIAIGLGLLLGFQLPVNFRSPYQSASLQEFWRRWHISLSTWLRDYLYISLGGNRKGKLRTYINLMITMLLGGLWHGASWQFVVWGGLHGAYLAVERFFNEGSRRLNSWRNEQVNELDDYVLEKYIHSQIKWRQKLGNLYAEAGLAYWDIRNWLSPRILPFRRYFNIFLTFHFVCYCWIFFRARTFGDAIEVMKQIASNFHPEVFLQFVSNYPQVLGLMLLGYLLHFVPDRIESLVAVRFKESHFVLQSLALAVIIWLTIQTRSADLQPFIYFQF